MQSDLITHYTTQASKYQTFRTNNRCPLSSSTDFKKSLLLFILSLWFKNDYQSQKQNFTLPYNAFNHNFSCIGFICRNKNLLRHKRFSLRFFCKSFKIFLFNANGLFNNFKRLYSAHLCNHIIILYIGSIWKNSEFRDYLFFAFSFFTPFWIRKDFYSMPESLWFVFKNYINNFAPCFIFSCPLASFAFIHFNSKSSRTPSKCRTKLNDFTHNFSDDFCYSSAWLRKNDFNMQIKIRFWKWVFNFLGTFYAYHFHLAFTKQFFRKFKI